MEYSILKSHFLIEIVRKVHLQGVQWSESHTKEFWGYFEIQPISTNFHYSTMASARYTNNFKNTQEFEYNKAQVNFLQKLITKTSKKGPL